MDVGTVLHTWLTGKKVGSDSYGNKYYRSRRRPLYGRERRWVMFNGQAEASKIPPEWHAWLHHMVDEPLTEAAAAYSWQKPHVPNLSGTALAYRPKGHDLSGGKRVRAAGDYEPWTPN